MIASIQVWVEREKDFTAHQLEAIEGQLGVVCSELERECSKLDVYIRAQFSVDGKAR